MDVLVRKISQIFQEKYITDEANSKCFLKYKLTIMRNLSEN